MFKESATNLNNISVAKGIEWLDSIDTVLSDCDGKFYIPANVIETTENNVN